MANEWMMPVAMMASVRGPARRRVQQALPLTMMPGTAAQVGAFAAVGITQQAQDGVRRERRVAAAVVDVVSEAITTPDRADLAYLSQLPTLRDVATQDLADAIKDVSGTLSTKSAAETEKVAGQAVAIADKLVTGGGAKLTAAQAKPYDEFLSLLSDNQKKKFIA